MQYQLLPLENNGVRSELARADWSGGPFESITYELVLGFNKAFQLLVIYLRL